MSDEKRSAFDLRSERDRFLAFAFTYADILIELDAEGNICFVDGATRSLLGLSPESLQGHSFPKLISLADRSTASEALQQARQGERLESLKLHLNHADEEEESAAFAVSGYALPSMKHHLFLTLSHLKPNVASDSLQARDVRSGLLREKAFSEAVTKMLQQARDSDNKLKLTLLNLPEIEALAEDKSEQASDLMESICTHLKDNSLGKDMATRIEPGVYGLLHDASLQPHQLVSRIEQSAEEIYGEEHVFPVMVRSLEMDPPAINEADCLRALRYMVYNFCDSEVDNFNLSTLSDTYQHMLDDTVEKIGIFKNTVHESGFDVALQPIVDMHHQELHCFEALVRFPEGEEGARFKNPFQFITFGEETGIIGDFDLAMCQKVLAILEQLSTSDDHPRVSVNLSGRSLSSTLFRDTLRVLLKDYPDLRRQILFEVTESAKIDDLPGANDFIQELRDAGHQCCLDDFGVGESSFDYIRELEVDFVKIDGSYIRQSATNKRGRHILKAMIQLCGELGMIPIGEMVEDEETADFLRQSGVGLGQGWHFGKPTTDIAYAVTQYYRRDKGRRQPRVVETAPKANQRPAPSIESAQPKARRVPKSWSQPNG